jgi:hypothetical protein
MHYIPENCGDTNVKRGFFELMEADAWRGDPAATFMLFGYPINFRKVDYDSPSIAVRQMVTSAKYRSASRAASVHSIEMMRTGDYSSDGLSGGPVFHLGQDQGILLWICWRNPQGQLRHDPLSRRAPHASISKASR